MICEQIVKMVGKSSLFTYSNMLYATVVTATRTGFIVGEISGMAQMVQGYQIRDETTFFNGTGIYLASRLVGQVVSDVIQIRERVRLRDEINRIKEHRTELSDEVAKKG